MMRDLAACVFALGLAVCAPTLADADNLVTNGNFEVTTHGSGQLGYNTDATGWNISGGYTFLFNSGTADTTGATGQYGNLRLWGPGDGSNNGLPASSPTGGNYIAQDSAFQQAAISQTINGLTIGQDYLVGFWWGAAQQQGFDGPTFDKWQVTFGSQTKSTSTVNIASHGFSGWMYQTFDFKATSTSQLLSFYAVGGPPGVPPFALLDGVSVNAVAPEGSAFGLMIGGLMGVGVFARIKSLRSKKKA